MTRNKIEILYTDIGNIIRCLRLSNNLPQKDIAKILEVSIQQLHKYEIGQNRISCASLLLLAEYFKVPLTYFFIKGDKI